MCLFSRFITFVLIIIISFINSILWFQNSLLICIVSFFIISFVLKIYKKFFLLLFLAILRGYFSLFFEMFLFFSNKF